MIPRSHTLATAAQRLTARSVVASDEHRLERHACPRILGRERDPRRVLEYVHGGHSHAAAGQREHPRPDDERALDRLTAAGARALDDGPGAPALAAPAP